jgi:hypothetical protein
VAEIPGFERLLGKRKSRPNLKTATPDARIASERLCPPFDFVFEMRLILVEATTGVEMRVGVSV